MQIFDLSYYAFNIYAVPPFVTSVLILLLAITVLVSERFSRISLSFFLMIIPVFLWLFLFSLVYCSTDKATALLWIKTAYLGIVFIPAGAYQFTTVVLNIHRKYAKFVLLSWIIGAFFYVLIFITNHFISGVYHYYWGYYPRLEWIGYPFLIYFFIMMIAIFHCYWTEYRKAAGQTTHKYRIRSLLTALGIAYVASLDFSASFGISLYPFGYLPIFGFIVIAARVIWKYRLIDITPAFAAGKIIDTMKDALFVFDQKGIIRVVNRSAVSLFNGGRELTGTPVGKIIDDRLFSDKLNPLIEGGMIENYEIPYSNAGGKARMLSLSASVMQDKYNQPIATVCIARDITELKHAEEELVKHRNHLEELVKERTTRLSETNKQLQQEMFRRKKMEEDLIRVSKLESIGLLAGGIAHDFNNLLTIILGNVGLYMKMMSLKPEEKGYEKLMKVRKAVNRAKGLTRQLLTFSRGGLPITRTVSVKELIKESVEFALTGSNVKCSYLTADDLLPADVDEMQINQVINNLIINAVYAMPGGGTIEVKTENIIVTQENYLPLTNGKYIRISIKDHGRGIEKEHFSKIFDPYFTTKEGGSGLGLATTYSIINKHKGHITVESEPGKGTAFYIYLPASEGNVEAGGKPEGVAFAGRGKVLVMDDEKDVRDTIGSMLEYIGYEVSYAGDGAETINAYKKAKESGEPFDVVIMDLTIPGGMGGKDAVKRLIETDPDVKAIVSSGYSNDPVMAHYRKYGFSGIVHKPYNIEELGKALEKVVNGRTK
ncbi:MAG TPA: response regulator [Nitrospirae bacterium]|nr:blue-light-activated protein [bacterium BMS3Abin06]HDH12266.1 response regulator [Nitrospirota bacterium]HDZ01142.1 response regulator [Nitrospirota bacterium]